MITDVNLVNPTNISAESPKESNDDDNPKEWSKRTVCVVSDSLLNGMDERFLSRERMIKVRPFSGAMVKNIYDHLRTVLKQRLAYIILHIGTNDASKNTVY